MIHALAEGSAEKAMRAISQHIQASQQERMEEYAYWEREALVRNQVSDFFHDKDSE
jgi:hypothetical protein